MSKKLNENNLKEYRLTAEEQAIFEGLVAAVSGIKESENPKATQEAVNNLPPLKEFLASPSATILIPKTIVMAAMKSAEPTYVASNFMKKVKMPQSGALYIFPTFGPMRAFDIAESLVA